MKKINSLLFVYFAIMFLPHGVIAHEETHEVPKSLFGNAWMIGFIITAILAIVFLALFMVTKSKFNATKDKLIKTQLKKRNQLSLIGLVTTSLLSLITIAAFAATNQQEHDTHSTSDAANAIDFMHIHGLGYSSDGEQIYVPAHDGLRVYQNSSWSIPEGPLHDYMGFSMVDDGFYSSGHPEVGSDLKNPFGVVKSTNFGKTIDFLDLYGEVDFHGMAVGYYSHAIYVFNPQKNTRMDNPGLFYSFDETKTWHESQLQGVTGQAQAFAVHPMNEETVVIGTQDGIFLSLDAGNNFENIYTGIDPTAIAFDAKGTLLVGGFTNKHALLEINIDTKKTKEFNLPAIKEEDAIAFIAANPVNEHEFAFATFARDIFLTGDHGGNWTQLVEEGSVVVNKEEHDHGGTSDHPDTDNHDHYNEDAHNHGESTDDEHEEGHDDHSAGHDNHGAEAHDHEHSNEKLPIEAYWAFNINPEENKDQELTIHITDLEGNAIENFEIDHEEIMHLIIVSKDLSVFQHIHPEYVGNGMFKVNTNFPKGGQYKLIADVLPNGSPATTTTWIDVKGNTTVKKITVDETLTKVVDGKEITLEFNQLKANEELTMTFTLHDETTDDPITDLQPYLGAIGHVVIIDEGGESYIHSHPINNDESGPKAEFITSFPEAGIYKIWGQFLHQDEIITVPFVVRVP